MTLDSDLADRPQHRHQDQLTGFARHARMDGAEARAEGDNADLVALLEHPRGEL